jgi:tetratricopeptide (TPR) repeat protein
MSIIEETLRNLQEKKENEDVHQDVPVAQVVKKKASTNIKPSRSRTFVVIAIVLSLLGLGAYYGLEKYQETLNKNRENLNFNLEPLESLTTPVDVSQKDVASPENTGVIDSGQETQVTSVDEVLEVEPNQKETVIEHKTPKTNMQDNAITEQTVVPPLSDNQGLELSQNDISKNDVFSTGTVEVVESNHEISVTTIDEETKFKQEFDSEEQPGSVNQSENDRLSVEMVEDLTHSEEKPTTSLLEEYVVGKQLKRARHLINIGSYAEAIDILKPIIDRREEIWDTYLLMGAAYLGLGELDNAEIYSGMGLAINGKVPQLWLQCAIVEQQRGKHEDALRILNEAEKLAPDIPEVQLNIGYSYDAIGNQKFSVKAYNSFLKLTEGNPAYMMVRYKVLERLRNVK